MTVAAQSKAAMAPRNCCQKHVRQKLLQQVLAGRGGCVPDSLHG
jgi:hypothetical protein